MLQRYKFRKINQKLMEEKQISITEIVQEISRFIDHINSVDFNQSFIIKLDCLKKAESSIKTIINMVFSRMNPNINPIIFEEDKLSGNYNHLILRLEKLTSSIGESRENLTKSLSNKIDLESNVIINNQNIYSFTSQLTAVMNDLIYSSLKQAYDSLSEIQEKAAIEIKDENSNKLFVFTSDPNKRLFDYLVYTYFFRTLQSTVPIFSNVRASEFSLKIPPPEISEFKKLYDNRRASDSSQNENNSQGESNTEEENNEGDSSNSEALDDQELEEVFNEEDV